MKSALIFIKHCFFGFNIICSLGKNCIGLFRKLKHDSYEFIIPSSSNMFFIPGTKSTFTCISDPYVNISNLGLHMSITIGIMNRTLTYCQFPT